MLDWRRQLIGRLSQVTPAAGVRIWAAIKRITDIDAPPPESAIVNRRWLRRTPYLHADIERVFHALLRLDMETGVGNDDEANPQIALRWSDDGGHTYTTERTVSAGAAGNYRARAVYRRLGAARSRLYEFSGADPVKIALIDAYLFVGSGRS